ncbi:MAG: transporter substrate-binding domain-containing protein [Gammaproteobacteria bacterium]|nr:MAG: transporter substrate-binding domain-containing protein [Gammaproteobacteria bacterium]
MRISQLIFSLLIGGLIVGGSSAQESSASVEATKHQATQKLYVVTPPFEKPLLPHSQYFPQLLELALQKTRATDGDFELTHSDESYTSNRLMAELIRGENAINIIWTSTSKTREQQLLPIKISIVRGLNSYRVFLIRKEDQEKFHTIHNLADLRKFHAGQGAQWPDSVVMQSNNLPLVTAARADLLFDMLVSKRFDYFPRGLYEVWGEQQLNAGKGLIIEDSLMFHYPAPIYFFVNKKDTALADRIERGLRIAMQDGSFDSLFFSFPSFKRGYEELQNSLRTRLQLTTDFPTQD